ncbi:MAG: hypothetical protein MJ134_04405 [Lachnospiraceae bacterium]|nr:hypothetical protein [Lachnospiraceae bacterium]
MKKFLSLILALAMVACMSVTAFAADPTTTLTVEVPANLPEYNLHIPADTTLTYGNTDKQNIGDYCVTDAADSIRRIICAPQYTDLINTNDSTDTISLALYDYERTYEYSLTKEGAWSSGMYICPNLYDKDWEEDHWPAPYLTHTLKAQVSDWTGATAGATYQATITYVVAVL